jgi:vancomycin resistance protein YoaR
METPIASPPTPQTTSRPVPAGRSFPFILAAIAGVALMLGLALVTLRLARPGVLPGIVISDVEMGGLSGPQLRDAVVRAARQRSAVTVTVTHRQRRVTALSAQLGYEMDVDRTIQAVLARGRQANPLAALADHLRAFAGTISVQPVQRVDDERIDAWAAVTARELSTAPIEGAIRFEGAHVVRVEPQPGTRVLPEPLREMTRAALLEGRTATITAQSEPIDPRTRSEDLDAVFAQAAKAVSAPITLSRGDQALTLLPAEIGALLRAEPGRAQPGPGVQGGPSLTLVVDPAAIERVISAEQRDALEPEPIEARFTVTGGRVSISESRLGFRLDPEATAARMLAVATGDGPRKVELVGETVAPSLTTEQARALNITERVSTFTTYHACCQPRVSNIHRIADLVNGAVIRPGETFSLNAYVGPRTAEKGFVEGGAIQDGEFVEEVGGGVSQFTTTMFNAAYFGGYDIVEHKPHSYFISRYPEGREATLNYPTVDLKFRNNSPYGILVQTSYTSTAVTVSFWATKWVTVSSTTGSRTALTEAETIYRENDALPPGSEHVVQEGGTEGFDVVVTRVRRFPDGRTDREEFRTRYLPEPRIVERNT